VADVVLQVADARRRLESLATNAGLLTGDADLADGWRVYRRFAADAVRCAEDTLFVYVGPRPDGETYAVRLGRHFEVNDDDKNYDHTEGVVLTFTIPLAAAPGAPQMSRMNGVPRQWDAFLAGVERDPAFLAAHALGPWRCAVETWNTRGGGGGS
jgi:hypothetical protein